MKKKYEKPSLEATEWEISHALLAESNPSGIGTDIPWGVPGMMPFQPSF